MESVRVERGTRASRIFAFVAVPALAALVATAVVGGDAGKMRLVGEMAYYLALAQLWNLLAGYAGLVSVGQQAYVGLGGYALFYLTGAVNMNVYAGAAARRAVRRADGDSGLVRRVPAARRLFRRRHLGGVRNLRAVGEPHRGARRRLRPVAHAVPILRQISARSRHARHDPVSDVACGRGRWCSPSSICCCARAMAWR